MKFFDFIKDAIMEAEGKPLFYREVMFLADALEKESKKQGYSPEIRHAVQQLHARLKDALHQFDIKLGSRITLRIYNTLLQNLALDCYNAIYDYEPSLMAAPGIWNQTKAFINNVLERYFSIEPIFHTEKSSLGIKEDFRKQFNTVKIMLKPAYDEESCCCSL